MILGCNGSSGIVWNIFFGKRRAVTNCRLDHINDAGNICQSVFLKRKKRKGEE